MAKIVIVTVPKVEPTCPTVGPALLKSHLNNNGISCKTFDLNIRLYNYLRVLGKEKEYFFINDKMFFTPNIEPDSTFKAFWLEHINFFKESAEKILEMNPEYIGLSLLSRYSQSVAIEFSKMIKKMNKDIKIVWGGPNVTAIAPKISSHDFVDHFISGDAEEPLLALLKGGDQYIEEKSKINNLKDLASIPIPNYDDVNWEEYDPEDYDRPVYITGSRGCVRSCSFCDVRKIWPKYRFRSAADVVKEIKEIDAKYDRKTFLFTDSLINGSISNFRELLRHLVQYKKINPDFTWNSQWIVRSMKSMKEEDFALMKESGCLFLDIGIESFVESVRYHMGKKFTNADMDYCFSMLKKYEIRATLMMIVGYPTETEEDHKMGMLKVRELADKGLIRNKREGSGLLHVCFTNTLILDDNSDLYERIKPDLEYYKDQYNWKYGENTPEVRVRRLNEMNELIKSVNGDNELYWLVERRILEQNQNFKNITNTDKNH